jgi:PRTRC genetic system protein A
MESLIAPPIEYRIFTGETPCLSPGKAYAYVMDGEGLKKFTTCRHFSAVVPVARAIIPGLPVLGCGLQMRYRLPAGHLAAMLRDARAESWEQPRETMYHVRVRDGMTRITKPPQDGGAGHLAYQTGDARDIAVDVHSHHQMSAFFSSTDVRDEQGRRIYAVIGKIFTRPQIRVRVGVYGHYLPVRVSEVFNGPGPFRDLYDVVHKAGYLCQN